MLSTGETRFAALGSIEQNAWLQSFAVRILEGKPEVLSLLDKKQVSGGLYPNAIRPPILVLF